MFLPHTYIPGCCTVLTKRTFAPAICVSLSHLFPSALLCFNFRLHASSIALFDDHGPHSDLACLLVTSLFRPLRQSV
ncbi:hypothetical protein HETIRDRAFT_418545 [Heterobasidion irregulare TC 32-1]|uniref:Uncharacterized protein n=1 Tax=Heterobasidion irregulare (strain TC 32-1) TaxID=747525 RepID=W4K5A1_HETIT|nr:uncharacterized protein HETIRDRAFT_418545 [Heterobasidion irregulare TC 32-1]ETW80545.1 hypothetical protein HETIRDRAFT_418545 [Heterobasidion irregulare TC 32-1]